LAKKQYTSIIRLLEHCGINTHETLQVSRIKKQLVAEFNMSPTGFIEVDGYTYTKNDVFEELEHPEFEVRLQYHQQLWKAPMLLKWLEKNEAQLSYIDNEIKPFLGNRNFDDFFSPFFSVPFSNAARNLLLENRLANMEALLVYEDFLLPAEREEAFKPIRLYLDDAERTLRNIIDQNYSMMRPKITHWITQDWHKFFNALPDEFYDIKYEIVTQLINIGVDVQKNHMKDCKLISKQLVLLNDAPEHLESLIKSNHQIYAENSSTSISTIVRILFFVAIIAVRVATIDACKTSTNHFDLDQIKRTNYPITHKDDSLQYLLDSILDKEFKGKRNKKN
jgi:hypothetical protein